MRNLFLSHVILACLFFLAPANGAAKNAAPKPAKSFPTQSATAFSSIELHRGWTLQSSCKVKAAGGQISKPGFSTSGWHRAEVPTTVVGALIALPALRLQGLYLALLTLAIAALADSVFFLDSHVLARGQLNVHRLAIPGLSASGSKANLILLVVVFALAGVGHQHFGIHAPEVPDGWKSLVLTAVVLAAIGVVVGSVRVRRRLMPSVRAAVAQVTALVHEPLRAIALLGSAAGITAAFALALAAAVQAAGGGPSLVSIFAVYLGSSALAAAAPTPSGLGALEAALVAGLTSVGQAAAPAVTAVLVFRVVTYWLPALPGAAAFWVLRRHGTL